MNSNIEHKSPNKLTVEKYFTGELNNSESAELESHLQDCRECSEYFVSLEENKRQFHGAHPFGSFLDAVQERSTPWYKKVLEILWQPALRPALAMVLVVGIALPVYFNYVNNQTDIRFKAPDTITFVYRRDGIIKRGTNSDTFRANDEIQILYATSKARYITLFSVDSRDRISFYHPDSNSEWCSIEVGSKSKQEQYPSSITLDDTPGNELIVAIFSPKPLSVEKVEQKVKKVLDSEAGNLTDVKQEVESGNLFKKSRVKTIMLNKR